jgi:hypothetical protein
LHSLTAHLDLHQLSVAGSEQASLESASADILALALLSAVQGAASVMSEEIIFAVISVIELQDIGMRPPSLLGQEIS